MDEVSVNFTPVRIMCPVVDTPSKQVEVSSGAITWLCSDQASYVNGHSMLVDGGTVCR